MAHAEIRSKESDDHGFLYESLGRLQTKLLNLTKRNPLVNFRHSERSKRFIRIVDELPDAVCERLLAGDVLKFESIGSRPNAADDEQSPTFLKALERAKTSDAEFLEKAGALAENQGQKVYDRLLQELKGRVRDRLGLLPLSTGTLSAAEAAKKRGINASWELPAPVAHDARAKRHTDKSLQTLLFDDQLESSLNNLRDIARLSVDEKGINPLQMLFGFVEWYESEDSEEPLFAPLLLLTVSLERELKPGRYEFSLRADGSDLQVNPALCEKFKKDFGVLLPEMADEDTPESYFSSVALILRGRKSWKLHRWMTTAICDSTTLALIDDLKADQWQQLKKGPAVDVISGSGETGTMMEEPDSSADALIEVDRPDIPLVSDADSSQLAAIAEVVAGKSLVIEGPPGTGKSQTITNIIAATLAAGKTVLFVAEKLAALQVVQQRLHTASLSDFCLELHAIKGSRSAVAQAFASRLRRQPSKGTTNQLNQIQSKLRELRRSLRETVESIAKEAGQSGMTTQQLLCKAGELRARTRETLPARIDDLEFADALSFSSLDRDRLLSFSARYSKLRSQLAAKYGRDHHHGWGSLVDAATSVLAKEAIIRSVAAVERAASKCKAMQEQIEESVPGRFDTPQSWQALRAVGELQPPSGVDDSIAFLQSPANLTEFNAFLDALRMREAERPFLESQCTQPEIYRSLAPDKLREIVARAQACGLAPAAIGELPGIVGKQSARANSLQALAKVSQQAREACSPKLQFDDSQASDIVLTRVVDLAVEGVALRQKPQRPAFLQEGVAAVLGDALQRANALRKSRQTLGANWSWEGTIDPGVLRQHARTLRAGGKLCWLSSRWHAARRALRELARVAPPRDFRRQADELDRLAAHIAEEQQQSADQSMQAIFGTAWQGIDTDIDSALQVAQWADRVRACSLNAPQMTSSVSEFLFTATESELARVAACSGLRGFDQLRTAVQDGSVRLQVGILPAAEREAKRFDEIAAVAKSLAELGFKDGVRVGELPEFANRLEAQFARESRLDGWKAGTAVLGARFRGANTELLAVQQLADFLGRLSTISLPEDTRQWLYSSGFSAKVSAVSSLWNRSGAALKEHEASLQQLCLHGKTSLAGWMGTRDSDVNTTPFEEVRAVAGRCAVDASGLDLLVSFIHMTKEAQSLSLKDVIQLFEEVGLDWSSFDQAVERVLYSSMARMLISASPSLSGFSKDSIEATRLEFRNLDQQLLKAQQQAIVEQLLRNEVPTGVGTGPKKKWTEIHLIKNEAYKSGKHIAVRDLLSRAPKAAQALKPCFMMSPLAVAQYLVPGAVSFDLVVMDEASQLRPEYAMGAVLRGAQVVVVGDPKQLPPTTFFTGDGGVAEAADVEEDEETFTIADEKSILDQAMSTYPMRRLTWHYRSRHPSLIAFSNHEFYDSQLSIFPSPVHESEDRGVKRVLVPGVYLAGRNEIEADHVAEAVVLQARQHPDRSLGVATMNRAQCELVKEKLDALAKRHPEFDAWRRNAEKSSEPFFVKNIENVQGDERDAIFISTVYGRSPTGGMAQRFGPINQAGGYRRLNVLFTRAKYLTKIFTTMSRDDILVDEKSPWGIRALRGYLEYAETGRLEGASPSGREPESEFERSVLQALAEAGYQGVAQVGVSGYRIDIGVRNPDRPGEFMVGIECDGATYHSSRSARDRDRLRQEVLERLGWRIYRIWSMDWFASKSREVDKLLAFLKSIASDRAEP